MRASVPPGGEVETAFRGCAPARLPGAAACGELVAPWLGTPPGRPASRSSSAVREPGCAGRPWLISDVGQPHTGFLRPLPGPLPLDDVQGRATHPAASIAIKTSSDPESRGGGTSSILGGLPYSRTRTAFMVHLPFEQGLASFSVLACMTAKTPRRHRGIGPTKVPPTPTAKNVRDARRHRQWRGRTQTVISLTSSHPAL